MTEGLSVLAGPYVGFAAGTSLLSRLIQWFTGGRASHAFLAWFDPVLDGWVSVGSEAEGWVVLDAPRMGACWLYQIPGVDLQRGLAKARPLLGRKYDFAGLLGFAGPMLWWKVFRARLRNVAQDSSRWYCSEAVAQIIRWSGGELAADPGDTDPKRLEEEVLALGGVGVPVPW